MPQPDERAPVTILGAGIVGICTALSLLERGVPVTLVDRGEPGQETSMGNAGVVSPWSIIPQSMPSTWKTVPKLMFGYGRPLSIHPATLWPMIPWGFRFLRRGHEAQVRRTADAMSNLCAPSIELYEKHLRGTGSEALLAESFYVHAFRDGRNATLEGLDNRIRAEKGADLELVGRDRLAEIEPALSPKFKAAVLIKGQARMRSPGRLGAVLANKVRAMGAAFRKAEVQQIKRSAEGWEVRCDDGVLKTERLVICLGAWSPGLLKGLGLTMPLMTERGYHIEFSDPGIALNNSVLDVDAKVVASSMEGGLRVAGQAEFAPVDAPANPKRERQLLKIAQAALPDLQPSERSFWMGRRPSFPDSLPMIDHVDNQPGLYLNLGHSHYGLMMAPASGELLARLVCGDHSNTDRAPYSAMRF